jgi:phenylalanyl-tRNA synthetase beta subunit
LESHFINEANAGLITRNEYRNATGRRPMTVEEENELYKLNGKLPDGSNIPDSMHEDEKAFDIDNEVYYAEINWKELMKAIKSAKVNFKELSKFPAVKRDLALLIDKNIQFAEIEKIAYETEKKLLKEVELFDVYEGKNLEPGKKSYAVSFLLQDESATLNDKQIDKIMSKLIANLENKLGAKLR